jgi:hypothetical protein
MLALAAAVLAAACSVASLRRVWLAANPTALHPDELLRSLSGGTARTHTRAPREEMLARLEGVVARVPDADWERDLLEAARAEPAEARAALVNEQLTELDYRIQRWARVPRVCASIAASGGLLLATLVLRKGLAIAETLPPELAELVLRGLVGEALTVVALGVTGAVVCITAQGQAKRFAADRAASADRLVLGLEGEPESSA